MLSVQSMLILPSSSPTNLYPIVYDLDDAATREAYFNNKTVRTSHNCGGCQFGAATATQINQSISVRKGSTKAHQHISSGVGYSNTSNHDDTFIKPIIIPTFNDLYIITRLITKTKRSSVCECIHRQSGQPYCVKIFAEGNQKCSQEVFQMLSFCSNHDNLLPPYELLVENQILQSIKGADILMNTKTKVTPIRNSHGKVYLVVKYMELGNLKSYVTEHQSHKYMEEMETKKLAIQLLNALQYLHETAHVEHGDLSPSNILLEKVNNEIKIKVTDFGRSKGIVQTETSSAASDMLSFGSVVYFMLAGYFPTDAKLSTTKSSALVTSPKKEMVVTYPSHFSRHAKQFLSNCFHTDPSIRLTATEALQHVWLSSVFNEIDRLKPQTPVTVTLTSEVTPTANITSELEQNVTKKKHHRRNATICIASLRRKEKRGKNQGDTSGQQMHMLNGVDKSNNKKGSESNVSFFQLFMNYYNRVYSSKEKFVSSRNLNTHLNDYHCDETLTTTSSMQSVVSLDDDVEVVTHPTKMGRNAIYRSWWS